MFFYVSKSYCLVWKLFVRFRYFSNVCWCNVVYSKYLIVYYYLVFKFYYSVYI